MSNISGGILSLIIAFSAVILVFHGHKVNSRGLFICGLLVFVYAIVTRAVNGISSDIAGNSTGAIIGFLGLVMIASYTMTNYTLLLFAGIALTMLSLPFS